ncbi:MAG: hypothetical protein ACLFP8_08210 [Alphaproteobacteria bacterium]
MNTDVRDHYVGQLARAFVQNVNGHLRACVRQYRAEQLAGQRPGEHSLSITEAQARAILGERVTSERVEQMLEDSAVAQFLSLAPFEDQMRALCVLGGHDDSAENYVALAAAYVRTAEKLGLRDEFLTLVSPLSGGAREYCKEHPELSAFAELCV